MSSHRITTTVIAALAAAAAGTAIAGAGEALTDPGAATATVSTAATLKAGDTAPFSVAGVKQIRRGKLIPKGYVLPGYRVVIHNGDVAVGAEFKAKCPRGKTLRSFAETGRVAALTLGSYPGRSTTLVQSFPGHNYEPGDADGVIYAVCR